MTVGATPAEAQTEERPAGCVVGTAPPLEIAPADEELARLAKALGHPARVAIVRYLLRQGERVCTDLSGVVPLAHATAMQHIKVLKESGLLSSARYGRNVVYCVSPGARERLQALVGEL